MVLPAPTASAQGVATSMKLGDYVQMGTYYGEPILWRVVGFQKVNGSTVDPANFSATHQSGYLPLLMTDKILTMKSFSAKPIDATKGSFARGDANRTNYGSHYWGDSTLRQWLNSSANSISWANGNKPSASQLRDQKNAYDTEKGFLTNFTTLERSAMKSVTQKNILSKWDQSVKAGGSAEHTYNYTMGQTIQNYDSAYYENVTDTMFVLDIRQNEAVYANRGTLGNDYYVGRLTQKVIDNSTFTADTAQSWWGYGTASSQYPFLAGNKWHTWLRSPYSGSSYNARYVSLNGNVGYGYYSWGGGFGVRPAFFLNQSSVAFTQGNGTSASPYILGNKAVVTAEQTDYTWNYSDKDKTGEDAPKIKASSGASGAKLLYSTTDSDVATVNADGTVNIKGAGTCIIRITTEAVASPAVAAADTVSVTVIVKPVKPYKAVVTATSGEDGKVTLTWGNGAGGNVDNGGSAISNFYIERKLSTDSDAAWEQISQVAGNRTSIIDSNVTNGVSYDYRVYSLNAVDYSEYSDVVTAKPYKAPDAPNDINAEATTNGSVAVSWKAPTSNGGDDVTSYQVKVYADNEGNKGAEITDSVTVNPAVYDEASKTHTSSVIGLEKGTPYHFGVAAVNKAGAGDEAVATATTWTNPAVPQEVTVNPSAKGSVIVEWAAPVFDGGTPITSYTVSYRQKGTEEWSQLSPVAPTSAKRQSAQINGLTTGETYEVKVAAVNKSGGNGEEMTGPECDVLEVIAADRPSVPEIVGFEAGNRIITITEIKNTNNNAAPVTSFMVYYRRVGTEKWTSKLIRNVDPKTESVKNVVIDGLTNNTEYEIKAAAVNVIGESDHTTPVTQRIGLPGPVKNLEIVPKAGQMVEISFDAADSNGSEILYYNIYADNDEPVKIYDTHTIFDATSRDNGDSIDLKITAVSKVGEGRAEGKLVTVGAPTSPVLTKYETDTEGVTVGWKSAATNGNAIRSYTVYIIDENGNKTPFTRNVAKDEKNLESFEIYIGKGDKAAADKQFEFVPGGKYTVEVTCTNSAGEGLPSNSGSFTFASPASPENVEVEAGNRKLTVSWTRPANNGGYEIIGYNIYLNDDTEATASVSWEKTADNQYQLYVDDLRDTSTGKQPYGTPQGDLYSFSVVIEGLANGNAYTAQVTAINEKGEGPSESNGEPDIPVTQASAPQNVTAEALSGSVIKLSWSKPVNNGGSAITGYVVRAYKVSEKNYKTGEYEEVSRSLVNTYGTGDEHITGTSYRAAGLETGFGYEFEVTAITEAGEGLVSDAADAATFTKPGKAVITDAYSGIGNTRIYVEWSAPKDTGNAAMTGYDIYIGDFKMNTSRITEPDADGVYRYTIVSNRITSGQPYDINVVSYNTVTDAAGYRPGAEDDYIGVSSETKSVTAGSIPPPKDITLEGNNQGDLTISWNLDQYKDSMSYISSFHVYLNGEHAYLTKNNTENSVTLTMRPLGKELSVQVAAVPIQGVEGSKSTAKTIILGTPATVSNVNAVAEAKNSVKVTWNAPTVSESGSKFYPTKYTVYVDGVNKGEIGDGVVRVPDGTPMEKTIEGLEGGRTYDITVTVTNGYGEGAHSAPVSVTPWAEPEAPVISDIKPGVGSFSFKYADGSGNGAQITSHKVYMVNGDGSEHEMTDVIFSDNVATVKGVADGAEHTFYMTAVNSRGLASAKGEVYTVITGVPAAPANLSAQAGVGNVLVSFDKSEDVSPEIPVSRYDIMVSSGAGTEIVSVIPDGSTTYTKLIDSLNEESLKNGTEYTFQVRAVNELNGEGSWSNPVTAVPGTPEAPVIISAVPASGKISVEWTVPQSNSSKITSYAIYLNGEATPVLTTIKTSAVIDGLENGKEYAVTVSAINLAGEGTQSRPEMVIPGGVPGAIDGDSIHVDYTYTEADGCGFVLSWDYPQDDGGLPIREYKVTGEGSIVIDNENRTATITGLEKGKDYSYDIVARSDAGDGAKYTTKSFTTLDTPGAPSLEGVDSFNNSFVVTWTAPANNGGTDITEYIITAQPKNGGTPRVFTVKNPTPNSNGEFTETISEGLTNQKYILSIAAVNAVGKSINTSNSITVTLTGTVVQTVPGVPNNFEVIPGDGEVTLTWNAPDTDGHSTITKYVVWSGKDTKYMSVVSRLDANTLSSVNGKYTYTVTGLKNGEERFYKINAVNSVSADGGAFTQAVAATPVKITVPGAPTWPEFNNTDGISAYETNAEGTEITITWNAPVNKGDTGISAYEVYVDENMNGEELAATVTDTSYVLTNLAERSTYNIRVKAVNETGDGTFSKYIRAYRNLNIRKGSEDDHYHYDDFYKDGIYAEIDADYNGFVDANPVYTVPSQPVNPTLTETIDDSQNAVAATVKWEKPESDGNKPIQGYYIYINGEKTQYSLDDNSSSNARIMTLADDNDETLTYTFPVEYGETYAVSVSAYNSVGEGIDAKITPALKMALEPPFDLEGHVTDKKYVDLTWSIPNTNITGYVLYVDGIAGSEHLTLDDVTTDTDNMTVSYRLELKEINKEYNFSVSAKYNDKESAIKDVITVDTREEKALAPTNLQLDEENGDVVLTWNAPANLESAGVAYYQIYVDGEAYESNKADADATSATVTIPNFTDSKSYLIKMQAISEYGTAGELSEIVQYDKSGGGSFGTDTPAKPTDVVLTPQYAEDGMLMTEDNLVITWKTAPIDDEHTVKANKFKVHLYYLSREEAFNVDAAEDDNNSFTCTINPGVDYTIRIEPWVGDVTSGAWSNNILSVVNPEPEQPAAPELSGELSEDKTSVTLTATGIEEGLEYYLIVNGDEENAQAFVSGQTYTLSSDIVNYSFRVKVVKTYSNGDTANAYSNTVSVNTNPDPEDPTDYISNPPVITGTLSNGNKVKVFWTAPEPREGEKGKIESYQIYVNDVYTATVNTDAEYVYEIDFGNASVTSSKDVEVKALKTVPDYGNYIASTSNRWKVTPNCNIVGDDDYNNNNQDTENITNPDTTGNGTIDEKVDVVTIPIKSISAVKNVKIEFIDKVTDAVVKTISNEEGADQTAGKLELANGAGTLTLPIDDRFNSNATYDIVVSKTAYTKYTVTDVPYAGLDKLEKYFENVELFAGDLDGKNGINSLDQMVVSRNFGKIKALPSDGDMDDNGVVNSLDQMVVSRNFGKNNVIISWSE